MNFNISTNDILPLYDELYFIDKVDLSEKALELPETKQEEAPATPNKVEAVNQQEDSGNEIIEVNLAQFVKSGKLDSKVYIFIEGEFLNESSESYKFLEKVLMAVKLPIGDVALILNATTSFKLVPIDTLTQKTTALYFANTTVNKLPYFDPKTRSNLTLCCAPELETLMANRDLKAKLWTVLQRLLL